MLRRSQICSFAFWGVVWGVCKLYKNRGIFSTCNLCAMRVSYKYNFFKLFLSADSVKIPMRYGLNLANAMKKLYNEREVVCLEQLQKQYKELTFTDDFMFGKVLINNPEICRRLLEVLLEIKIKKISFPERQKTIEILSDGKGIRLDVYVDDENGTIYNIEMQTKVKKELPKRSRYYQGMIDMNLIERGAKYKELKLSFVIFICLKDPFGYHLPVYRFENICVQNRDILLKDEAIKVFINADGDLTGLPEDLAAFLQY